MTPTQPTDKVLSTEEKERQEYAAREQHAHQRMIEFLDAFDALTDVSKQLQAGTVTSLIGYPLWVRLVYCRTTPTEHLLKETLAFQTLPEPVITAEIHKHTRELLGDIPFVAFVQSQPTRADRRNWLENTLRTSVRKGLPFIHFAGRLSLPGE